MTTATALLASAATSLVVLAAPAAPPAHATTPSVSPGDAISHITADGANRCTLGFVFTENTTTYGLTAGHCRGPWPGYVKNVTTGALGRFLATSYDPDAPTRADYALIDFGDAPAGTDIIGTPITGVDDPDDLPVICHTGISSGIHCGQLYGHVGHQYTTTGMPASIPGDSGGPVWTLRDGGAVIVGLWLGEHITADGTSYGRFGALSDAIEGLALGTSWTQPRQETP